jgi:hypothetical protein
MKHTRIGFVVSWEFNRAGRSVLNNERVRLTEMEEILSAFLGAIIGALAAAGLYAREARRQLRIDSLRRFVANRFNLTGVEFSQALNEAVIIYADRPKVIQALDTFRSARTNENLINLYRVMSDAAGVPHTAVSDELFCTAFNIVEPLRQGIATTGSPGPLAIK